jgi:hypothetical protein
MTEGTPVKAHLRIAEITKIPDADGVYYTMTLQSNDNPNKRDDAEGTMTYVDHERTVDLEQGQIITLVFAEDVDFSPPEPLKKSKLAP